MDVIQRASERAPVPGERMLCRHPFEEQKRAHVVPTRCVVSGLLCLSLCLSLCRRARYRPK